MLHVVLPQAFVYCRPVIGSERSVSICFSFEELPVDHVSSDPNVSSIACRLVLHKVPFVTGAVLVEQDAVSVSLVLLVPFAFILVSIFDFLLGPRVTPSAPSVVVFLESRQDATDLLNSHLDLLK